MVMQRGHVAWSGPAGEAREAVLAGYLGSETTARA
jgi:hypothetical protein